jgi:hypothetical protein
MSTLLDSNYKTRRYSRNRLVSISGIVLIVAPVIAFYAILFRNVLNVPFLDDYPAILGLANHAAGLSRWNQLGYLFTEQHNEYKLVFEHAIVWTEFLILKRVDFRILCVIGDLFVVLIGIALWKMFLPSRDFASRAMLFVPVAWLLFELQYVETLNWAMTSLQYLPVIAFSLLVIYFLDRDSLGLAIFFLVAAVASSGNGLFVIPIGVLMLRRRSAWLVASAACIAIYFFHYNTASSQSPIHKSILGAAIHFNPIFPLSFIGNAAAFPLYGKDLGLSLLLCPLIGLSLCVFFAFNRSRNRALHFCTLFLLLTAIGVGCMRSELGLRQALASRYGIHSALLLICAWLFVAEHQFREAEIRTIVCSRIWQTAVFSSMVFCVLMDVGGYHYLTARNNELKSGMDAYDPSKTGSADFQDKATAILQESQRRGIYIP